MKPFLNLIFFLISFNLCAQWQQTNGPLGGPESLNSQNLSFGTLSNKLFVGTQVGLFCSSDTGNSWSIINIGLPVDIVKGIKIHEKSIYVSFQNNGLYCSQDNGITWKSFSKALPKDEIYGVELFKNEVFIYYSNSGLYYSPDNGLSWRKIYQPDLNGFTINRPIFMVNEIKDKIYVGCVENLLVSSDTGKSWTSIYSNLPKCPKDVMVPITFDPTKIFENNNVLYLSNDIYNDIFYSTNNGLKWNRIEKPNKNNENDNFAFSDIVYVHDSILCAAKSGFYLFSPIENKWNILNYKISSTLFRDTTHFLYLTKHLFASGRNLFILTDDGIYISKDSGFNWSELKLDISKEEYKWTPPSVLVNDNNILVRSYNGLALSLDNGISWKKMKFGWPNTNITSLSAYQDFIIAGGVHDKIYYSKDHGDTWLAIKTGFETYCQNSIRTMFAIDNDLYIEASGGLYYTRYLTEGWKPFITINVRSIIEDISGLVNVDSNKYRKFTAEGIYLACKNRMSLYDCKPLNMLFSSFPNSTIESVILGKTKLIIGNYSGIFTTDINDINWKKVYDFKYGITSFETLNSIIFAGTTQGVLKSENDGLSWKPANKGLPMDTPFFPKYTIPIKSFSTYKNNIFIGTYRGVFMSKDFGENWISISDGLKYGIETIAIDDQYIYVGTQTNGVFRRALKELK
jgi:photosystem II stability/assembly factor-like uncharacterized protein